MAKFPTLLICGSGAIALHIQDIQLKLIQSSGQSTTCSSYKVGPWQVAPFGLGCMDEILIAEQKQGRIVREAFVPSKGR